MPTVKVRSDRNVRIPDEIFRRLKLKNGDTLKIDLLDDATILLVSKKRIPKNQKWFWTPTWQRWYREALQDVKHGKMKSFDSIDELMADLHS